MTEQDELTISEMKQQAAKFKLMSNMTVKRILDLLYTTEPNTYSISKLQKKLHSGSYRLIWQYVKALERHGLVDTFTEKNQKGSPVKVCAKQKLVLLEQLKRNQRQTYIEYCKCLRTLVEKKGTFTINKEDLVPPMTRAILAKNDSTEELKIIESSTREKARKFLSSNFVWNNYDIILKPKN